MNVFYIAIDTLIQEINSRFEAMKNINEIFFLFGNLIVTAKIKQTVK